MLSQATIDETERHAGEGEVARAALDAILGLTPEEALAMPEVRARLDARDGADGAVAEGARCERTETSAWLSREVRDMPCIVHPDLLCLVGLCLAVPLLDLLLLWYSSTYVYVRRLL